MFDYFFYFASGVFILLFSCFCFGMCSKVKLKEEKKWWVIWLNFPMGEWFLSQQAKARPYGPVCLLLIQWPGFQTYGMYWWPCHRDLWVAIVQEGLLHLATPAEDGTDKMDLCSLLSFYEYFSCFKICKSVMYLGITFRHCHWPVWPRNLLALRQRRTDLGKAELLNLQSNLW